MALLLLNYGGIDGFGFERRLYAEMVMEHAGAVVVCPGCTCLVATAVIRTPHRMYRGIIIRLLRWFYRGLSQQERMILQRT
jgi:hypothetical protein